MLKKILLACLGILFSFNFSLRGCDKNCLGNPCEYGHRRCLLQNTIVSIPLDNNQSVNHDFTRHFKDQQEKSELIREKLIQNGSLGHTTEQDKKDKKESKKDVNVVSFGFVFFGTNGNILNYTSDQGTFDIFYFRPHATSLNIKDPFYFFSGRTLLARDNQINNNWTALSAMAPKEKDLETYETIKTIGITASKSINEVRGYVLNDDQKSLCTGAISTLIDNVVCSTIKKGLITLAQNEDFFTSLKKREKCRSRSIGVCKTYSKCIDPFVTEIGACYLPKKIDCEKDTSDKDIKYFVHSEQYALFLMKEQNEQNEYKKTHFQVFLEAIPINKGSVNSLVVLIYTRATMCVRCSHSIVFDFIQSGDSLQKTIKTVFNLPVDPTLGLMAACRHSYQSNLHTSPPDSMEKFLKGEVSEYGDKLIHYNSDDTVGYKKLKLNGADPLIYHYHADIYPLTLFIRRLCSKIVERALTLSQLLPLEVEI